MDTTMAVAVDELCTSNVANTPIIRPATGLDNNSLFLNVSPAVRPAERSKLGQYFCKICQHFRKLGNHSRKLGQYFRKLEPD